ncbi:MAG: response regulator [Candidatus Zixiibacteriota bacterium]
MSVKASVLIVDDDKYIRDILSRIVTREGYKTETADDGVEAFDKIRASDFNFVISDVNMPKMDGIELLKKIKEYDNNILVLLITSKAGKYSADNILKIGADFFITKPFKNAEIAKTLDTLNSKRIRRQKKELKPATV